MPVLSEQTTETAPNVSTDGSLRTIVLALTIFCTPKAKTIVTTAGKPSGTAATAKEIANMKLSTMPSIQPSVPKGAWALALNKSMI